MLGSLNRDLTMTTNQPFSTTQSIIGSSELTVKSSTPGSSIIAEGGRDYSLAILIILIMIIWPGAVIYYFTRKPNSISVSLFPKETGCSISASSRSEEHTSELQLR